MQKLNEKKILGTVPKKLQLAETFWECPEFSKKGQNQKGITLIALIITIIVMLILVGVTINVVLNGGLFQKAETATRATEEKAILEEMLAMMDITDEGKIDYSKIITKIGQKYKVENYIYPNATITGKLGKYNYIVSETEIKIGSSSVDNTSELEEYFFNEDGTGKTGLMSQDENTGTITFKDDSSTIADASTSILYMNYNSADGEIYVVIEYKGADYKVEVTSLDFSTGAATIGNDNEKITKLETIYEGNDDETKIKQYFLGYSGTGKYFPNLLDVELSVDNPVFKNDNIISNASEAITIVETYESGAIIQYNGSNYVIEIDSGNGMVINNAYKIVEYEEPIVYKGYSETFSTDVIIIEKSNLVGYLWLDKFNMGSECKIKTANSLEELGFKESNEDNIEYSRVLCTNDGPQAVYNEDNGWYLIVIGDYLAIQGQNNFPLSEDVPKEKIDTIIQTIANANN